MVDNKEQRKSYRIVVGQGEGEIEEKKSRFISHVKHVESEEEALDFIEKIKKENYDARHNCFAYIIGSRQDIIRFSDNGEPSGTAGKPILEVINGEQLCNTIIVVTRYFGGTLLGTGGLVRAYTQSAKEGLAQVEKVWMRPGIKLSVQTEYNDMGRIRYMLEKEMLVPDHIEYGADVVLKITVPENDGKRICTQITELSNGKAQITEEGESYYLDRKE